MKTTIQIFVFHGVSGLIMFSVAWYAGLLVLVPAAMWGMVCIAGLVDGASPGGGFAGRDGVEPSKRRVVRLWWVLSTVLTMIVLAGLFWVQASKDRRSRSGRILRFIQGEAGARQTVHDLVEDIDTRPSLRPLQSWATNTLARFRSGQLKTNEHAFNFFPSTIPLSDNEIPDFVRQQEDWMSVEGGPELLVRITDGDSSAIVIAWYLHGIVVGPSDLPRYRNWYDAKVRPGIYVYHAYK